jgi:hypothetical protein
MAIDLDKLEELATKHEEIYYSGYWFSLSRDITAIKEIVAICATQKPNYNNVDTNAIKKQLNNMGIECSEKPCIECKYGAICRRSNRPITFYKKAIERVESICSTLVQGDIVKTTNNDNYV